MQGEETRFNHVLIQMIGGLTCRTKTAATNAIQQRIDTLSQEDHSDNWIRSCFYRSFSNPTQSHRIPGCDPIFGPLVLDFIESYNRNPIGFHRMI